MALNVATEYSIIGSTWTPRALAPVSTRRQRVQPGDIADPAKLSAELSRILDAQDEVNRALCADPTIGPRVFLDVACGMAGATALTVATGYGRPAYWHVVRWARTTAGGTHGLEELTNDGTTLAIRSYVPGTATILVF